MEKKGQSVRPFGTNKQKPSKNPRDNIGDHRVCYGTVDEMNEEWIKVRSENDMRTFYTKFYPAYPDQLIEAIVHTMQKKLERARQGDFDPENDLFNGTVMKADKAEEYKNKVWDYKAELKQQQEEGAMVASMKMLQELSVSE